MAMMGDAGEVEIGFLDFKNLSKETVEKAAGNQTGAFYYKTRGPANLRGCTDQPQPRLSGCSQAYSRLMVREE
jgi:hypothetical protein